VGAQLGLGRFTIIPGLKKPEVLQGNFGGRLRHGEVAIVETLQLAKLVFAPGRRVHPHLGATRAGAEPGSGEHDQRTPATRGETVFDFRLHER